MAILALGAVALLAMVVFVLLGATLELHRDVRQLRDAVGILDRPLSVDLGDAAGKAPSGFGLPKALDTAATALVLFVSETCATCRVLAASFDGNVPPSVTMVLEARSPQSAIEFLDSYRLTDLTSSGHVIVDARGAIARQLGLDTTPVAFRVESGVLTKATTVPSIRYLTSILPVPVRLRRPSSEPATGVERGDESKDRRPNQSMFSALTRAGNSVITTMAGREQ